MDRRLSLCELFCWSPSQPVGFVTRQRSSVPEFDEARVSGRVIFGKRRQFGHSPWIRLVYSSVHPQKFDVFAQLKPSHEGVTTASSTKQVQFPGLFASLRMSHARASAGRCSVVCQNQCHRTRSIGCVTNSLSQFLHTVLNGVRRV